MLFDLHVHTTLSACSRLELSDILARARGLGLDGVCLTDHETMAARELVREGLQEDGLCVVVGLEYATAGGDFLLFGPFEDLRAGLDAEELLPLVAESGGAAVMAHPCRRGRPGREDLLARGLTHLVEVINGRNAPWENACQADLAREYSLVGCGGSDAHGLEELGRVATRLLRPVTCREEFVAALRAGLCRPELPDAARLGPLARVASDPRSPVRL